MDYFYKKTLSPMYWKDGKFDKNVRRKILKIVNNFIEESELHIPVLDIRLTGSLANYNYNKYSDLDTHIITDFKKISKDVDVVKEALNGMRFVWNLKHNIYIKGHEVEMYFEDQDEVHISTGVYSLLNQDWVKEPKHNPPDNIDENLLSLKEFYYIDLINRLVNNLNSATSKDDIKLVYKKANMIKKKIMKIRSEALKLKGEYALENLLFKRLRSKHVLEKLVDVINGAYDKFFMESLCYNKLANKFLIS